MPFQYSEVSISKLTSTEEVAESFSFEVSMTTVSSENCVGLNIGYVSFFS